MRLTTASQQRNRTRIRRVVGGNGGSGRLPNRSTPPRPFFLAAAAVGFLLLYHGATVRSLSDTLLHDSDSEGKPPSEDPAPQPQQQQQQKRDRDRPPPYRNLVQIGANDGIKGNNDVVRSILTHPEGRAVLVEGSPSVFRLLTENIRTRYGDPDLERIVPINALLCDDDDERGGSTDRRKKNVFYSIDADKLRAASAKREDLPHWVEYQIGSLNRESTLRGLDHYLSTNSDRFRPSPPLAASDFLVEEVLDCTSFAAILGGGGGEPGNKLLQPFEVEVLAVDVEGYDAHVVLGSFEVEGLEPDLIVFEWKSAVDLFPDQFHAVMETLHSRGYETNCRRESDLRDGDTPLWKCNGGQDVWARKRSKPNPNLT